jgi:hypothetical protein
MESAPTGDNQTVRQTQISKNISRDIAFKKFPLRVLFGGVGA